MGLLDDSLDLMITWTGMTPCCFGLSLLAADEDDVDVDVSIES